VFLKCGCNIIPFIADGIEETILDGLFGSLFDMSLYREGIQEDFAIHLFLALNALFRNTTDPPWQVTDDIPASISLIQTFVSDFSSNTLTLLVRSGLS
jgi:hypothetical protein